MNPAAAAIETIAGHLQNSDQTRLQFNDTAPWHPYSQTCTCQTVVPHFEAARAIRLYVRKAMQARTATIDGHFQFQPTPGCTTETTQQGAPTYLLLSHFAEKAQQPLMPQDHIAKDQPERHVVR